MPETVNSRGGGTVFPVLIALSVSHLLNDTIQSLLPAIYPLLKSAFQLSYVQIGLITLTFQMTASVLQPAVGFYTDRRPRPFSLAIGMGVTLAGLVLLARAERFPAILIAGAFVGMGSSVFHPEASRIAKVASGGRHGLSQSIFQVGGNLGTSIGPLLAAIIIVPHGQRSILWFTLLALAGIVVLQRVGTWYSRLLRSGAATGLGAPVWRHPDLTPARVVRSVVVLLILVFSKYFYLSSMTNYYTFYLITKFHLSVRDADIGLFVFLFSVAAGTIIGGPLGDRYGRKYVIWASILGVAPFTLTLPHLGLPATIICSVFTGVILASAMSAILVYAQELIPGKPGTIAGLFFGFAFGMGGMASAIWGKLADRTSIFFVFQVCAYLPLLGLLTAFLPDLKAFDREHPAQDAEAAP
jgi:FSR family fosmidomycin resistance protein-like MFS transporter